MDADAANNNSKLFLAVEGVVVKVLLNKLTISAQAGPIGTHAMSRAS
jgi:hypothetical protein